MDYSSPVSSLAPFVASSATGQRGLKDGVEGQPRQTVNIFAARAQGHFPIDDREEWVNHISANAAVIIEIGKGHSAVAVHIELIERALRRPLRFHAARDLRKILPPLQNQTN